ncbi:Major facilitator superfamily domain, general substrate transporter [Akanthomyces lecanii RCEF 1005]|uniref:Major facilitator superfamily domain, general substrate transporter n=1 Tax=Akanthomyces lecanii RCEF 1005 TaxID=1081108 RepID=A0A168G4R5_CORDF|nr:Major facilitator superfamily domain, general substrate transporter [Akanthomyces lecanii RCEF 1005]
MDSVTSEKTPRLQILHQLRSSRIFTLLVICAAVFTDIFLYGVLVPVIPFALTTRVKISPSDVPRWNGILLALFNLGLCLGSPLFGFVADRCGAASRKLPFLFGLVTLAGATLLLCLGRTVALLCIGRALQGMSAAICWAVGLALLADTFGGRMGWAAGWVQWAMNAGFLLSPILGGLAYEKSGYYAVFYMGFGLLALDIVLRLSMAERSKTAPQANNASDETQRVVVGPEGVSLGNESIQTQKRNSYAFFAVVPPFVQATFHWDSLDAGIIFLCVLLPGFLSPLVGMLSDRYGTKWLATLGFLLSVPVFASLRFVTENTLRHKVLFGALLALMGVALAFSSTPLMAEITYAIHDKERRQPGVWGPKGVYGVGFGLFTTAFALGGVVGSFMGGYLYQGPGWGVFGWGFSIWCAGGAAVCALFVGSSDRIRII